MMPARDDDPDANYREEIDDLHGIIAALQADNWRLISEKAARGAPPKVWLPLKAAASDAGADYENARYWCEHGVIVAEKRGGRWFVRMDSLQAHVAALRGK
jgi:hypothetical protein